MLLLDKPFVSNFLLETIAQNNVPVVKTSFSETLIDPSTDLVDASEAIRRAAANPHIPILTTSENAIGWICENLSFLGLPAKIELFKNKTKFRELTASLHPDLYFREVALGDLSNLDTELLPFPLIVKPAVGFFSMGVNLIADPSEWKQTIETIHREIEQVKDLYPAEVFDSRMFILEQVLEGEEYAVDAYYDGEGKPVILGIFKHLFASDDDVSDRVYYTSREVIEENLAGFTAYLDSLGRLADVKNFAVHVEIRRDKNGTIRPIEVNPMRFGGWCSTADMTYLAHGINPYLAFLRQEKPDWIEILKREDNAKFAIVVLDNSTGLEAQEITAFDYDRLQSRFENVLEMRRINYHEYPVFGFLFTKTQPSDFSELTDILTSDLREFISV